MNAESIATISVAVVALTQLLKWGFLKDNQGPIVVLVLSALGVVLWQASQQIPFQRTDLFSYFTAWIVIATSAAGVFGFTRAGATAVTKTTPNETVIKQ